MYTITCDGETLYEPRFSNLYPVAEPKLTCAVNKAGSLTLKLMPTHPHYSTPAKLKSTIEVKDGTEILFRGRVLNERITLNGIKELTCEGAAAFLNDSLIAPFAFPDDFLTDAAYQTAASSGNVVAYFLGWLIGQHNAQVNSDRQLTLGTVTVTDSNNYIARSAEDYASTWDTVRGKLFESSLGGNFYIRHTATADYVDYLADYSNTNIQNIEFAANLADLTDEADGSEIYTICVPLGTKDDATGIRLDIGSLADGAVTADIYKSGKTLYSVSGVTAYGKITAPADLTTYDDVTVAANLQSKAATWLASTGIKLKRSISLKSADLHYVDASIAALRPGTPLMRGEKNAHRVATPAIRGTPPHARGKGGHDGIFC